jgi:hypothetical protein
MRRSIVLLTVVLVTLALLLPGAANAQGPDFTNVFVAPDTNLSQGLQANTSLDTTFDRQQKVVTDKLVLNALTSSFGNVSGYKVSAISKIVDHKAADTFTIETLATLKSTSTKQAKVVQLIAEYDIVAGKYNLLAYEPNYVPTWPLPTTKTQVMSASAQEDLRAKKQALLEAGRSGNLAALGEPEIKVNPNADDEIDTQSILVSALVSAPISNEDTYAGTAADWIAWWFYSDGYSVHKYKYPYANTRDIGPYLSYDNYLLAWYSNSHTVTGDYDGASATGLVYNGPPWSPDSSQYFWSDYFYYVWPYDGLYYAVLYVDGCNSMMWPLSSSILANSPRTYIGGMKLMPFYYSDYADRDFWYYTLLGGFDMSLSLWAAQYYWGLLGYYGAWGDLGYF